MKALFVLDDAGEAVGTVYHFCGERCRERFAHGEENLRAGDSDDAGIVDGEECDYCGQQLPTGGAAPETLCTGCGATVTQGMAVMFRPEIAEFSWRDVTGSAYCETSGFTRLHTVVETSPVSLPPVAIKPEAPFREHAPGWPKTAIQMLERIEQRWQELQGRDVTNSEFACLMSDLSNFIHEYKASGGAL